MIRRKSTHERQKEIADAALKIIGERGLREFTAASLANEVGIKDASIFRHFKDMSSVTLAALDRLEELLDPPSLFIGNPLEQLEAFVMSRFQSVAVQPGIQSLLFSDQISHALGEEGPRRIATLRNRAREFIRGRLHDALNQGLIREDLDIESLVLLVTGMVMGFLFAVKDAALLSPVAAMEKRTWQTFQSMIEKKEVAS